MDRHVGVGRGLFGAALARDLFDALDQARLWHNVKRASGMNTLVVVLIAVLMVWMSVCAWCGFRKRISLFFCVLGVGLVLNMAWMVFGLDARIFEPHALMAQGAATLYGLSACGIGWLAGRVSREWRASKIEDMGA